MFQGISEISHVSNFKRRIIGKIQKILEGKIQKMQKKISKNFIVSNYSLGHTDHLYTYRGHIEHVGFT